MNLDELPMLRIVATTYIVEKIEARSSIAIRAISYFRFVDVSFDPIDYLLFVVVRLRPRQGYQEE